MGRFNLGVLLNNQPVPRSPPSPTPPGPCGQPASGPTIARRHFLSRLLPTNGARLSGNGPQEADGSFITGRVPGELSVLEAQAAARLTAINQLAALKAELGSLNRVKRIVKVFGMVNSDPDFSTQPAVINGTSDLFVAVFGDCGKQARSAGGVAALPYGIAVGIDMVVEVDDDDDDDE